MHDEETTNGGPETTLSWSQIKWSNNTRINHSEDWSITRHESQSWAIINTIMSKTSPAGKNVERIVRRVNFEKGKRRMEVVMMKLSAALFPARRRPCHMKEHPWLESFLGWYNSDNGQNWLILTESRGQIEMAFKSSKRSSSGRGRGAPTLLVSLLSSYLCLPLNPRKLGILFTLH